MKKIIILIIALVIVAGGLLTGIKSCTGSKNAVDYRTVQIQRGELVQAIASNGTVEPEELVNVGTQVTGQILNFGKDKNGKQIDYGSVVRAGDVLVHIDDDLYKAEVNMAEAQVIQAEATLKHDEADLIDLTAKFDLSKQDWERAQRLLPTQAMTQASYDSYKSVYNSAKANVTKGESSLLQAKGVLAYAKAALLKVQRNLNYCTIRSPVDGVVIDRRVNIGQTVVSNMTTQSLFLIAKDLRKMQVWSSVNEADIDKIKIGQPVVFTVDAFPRETFHGQVGKIRLNASQTNNVITFTVEVNTDNASGRLLPYLTANVSFIVARHENVLKVSNAALRWSPAADQVAPQYQKYLVSDDSGKSRKGKLLWMYKGGILHPLEVTAGITNGTETEVKGEKIEEGMTVVCGVQAAGAVSTDTVNPFAPKMPGRKRN